MICWAMSGSGVLTGGIEIIIKAVRVQNISKTLQNRIQRDRPQVMIKSDEAVVRSLFRKPYMLHFVMGAMQRVMKKMLVFVVSENYDLYFIFDNQKYYL